MYYELLIETCRVQEKTEEEEFSTGPLSVLTMSVKNNTQVCGFWAFRFEVNCLKPNMREDAVFTGAYLTPGLQLPQVFFILSILEVVKFQFQKS